MNIATVYVQKLLLCFCFTQLDFSLKDKLRHTGCYLLLTLTENVTFSDYWKRCWVLPNYSLQLGRGLTISSAGEGLGVSCSLVGFFLEGLRAAILKEKEEEA